MSKEEIIEGLRMAVARGDDLQKAMTSFYNSGYPKEDIEEAARVVQNPQAYQASQIPRQLIPPQTVKPLPQATQSVPLNPTTESKPTIPTTPSNFPTPPNSPSQPISNEIVSEPVPTEQTGQTEVLQKVSGYGQKPSKTGTMVIFALVFFLLLLVGALIGIFLFKEEVSNFFSSFVA